MSTKTKLSASSGAQRDGLSQHTEPYFVVTLHWADATRRATHDPIVTVMGPMPRWKATLERARIRGDHMAEVSSKQLVVLTRRALSEHNE